tara:strand:+ start:116 stop:496 length:381 start_codon:yes stop_codon:yes gene_type:complete
LGALVEKKRLYFDKYPINSMEITAMDCIKKIRVGDFKPDTLLHLIATENIQLAYAISEAFGGTNQYIHQIRSIERSIRNRLIMKRASKLEGRSIIAKDVGLCEGYVTQIIRKTIRSSMERKFLKNI